MCRTSSSSCAHSARSVECVGTSPGRASASCRSRRPCGRLPWPDRLRSDRCAGARELLASPYIARKLCCFGLWRPSAGKTALDVVPAFKSKEGTQSMPPDGRSAAAAVPSDARKRSIDVAAKLPDTSACQPRATASGRGPGTSPSLTTSP